MLQSIQHHPGARIPQIVEVTGISTRTVERYIWTLKSMNLIHYEDRVSES
ncbi:MAG TPA: hypothetical protein DIW48_12085 [Sphaerochaeta sp.]|nr:hypothetical protein [Sphaerochaeta sp.]